MRFSTSGVLLPSIARVGVDLSLVSCGIGVVRLSLLESVLLGVLANRSGMRIVPALDVTLILPLTAGIEW